VNDLLKMDKGEPRVSTVLLAAQLDLQHRSVMKTVNDFSADFEQLGKMRFEITPSAGSKTGQNLRAALLNEDQCYLLLTFSRNSPTVRALKVKLVLAFKEARGAQALDSAEYLPGYHELHDKVHELAAGSKNEKFVHMNLNKLVNKTVGIGSGQRRTIAPPTKALVIVAQDIATRALGRARNHHDGYTAAKEALGTLGQALIGGGS